MSARGRNTADAGAGGTGAGPVALRFGGALGQLTPADRARLLDRAMVEDARVAAAAAGIVARVRSGGDQALHELARELDGVTLNALEVPRARWDAALAALAPGLRAALERAARNIARAHESSMPAESVCETEPGVHVGRRAEPFERVGVYAPGGRARYPSSVLMGAVPARIAGVRDIVLCTPPAANGEPDPVLLAAAAIAGVSRVFAIGGAGAIAALAYGTATVPAVRKIVGPGNAWVAAAKRLVAAEGKVAIDSPAGPSEVLVIADDGADPAHVALELVAQAEHDPDALALAVVVGRVAAARVRDALASAAAAAKRNDVVRAALAARGGVLEAATLAEALAFATALAPEHLWLAVREPRAALALVRDAGTVFVGGASSVAFGDYLSGGNHVLPTAGFARLAAGLGTLDFVRWSTWQEITPAAAARLADDTATLARAEGLPGHAAAALAAGALGAATADSAPGAVAAAAAVASDALWLDDNTNIFGAPPHASAALRAITLSPARYPSPEADALRAALAAHCGFASDEIVTGLGSDDVLELAFRALAGPGATVAWTTPTFSMVPLFVHHAGACGVAVPAAAGGALDVEALLATGAALTYVCSPNNPTGTLVSEAALDELLARTRGLVLLDEAYAEYAVAGTAPAPRRHPRLLVARTFSKAWGLAGLRVGWAAGPAALIARLAALRAPFRLAALSELAAVAALVSDGGWVAARATEVVQLRDQFDHALRAAGFSPWPSRANFVLLPVRDGAATATALAGRGVHVRPFAALGGIGDGVRITVPPAEARARVLAALREVMREVMP